MSLPLVRNAVGETNLHACITRGLVFAIPCDFSKGCLPRPRGYLARINGVAINPKIHFIESERFGSFFNTLSRNISDNSSSIVVIRSHIPVLLSTNRLLCVDVHADSVAWKR